MCWSRLWSEHIVNFGIMSHTLFFSLDSASTLTVSLHSRAFLTVRDKCLLSNTSVHSKKWLVTLWSLCLTSTLQKCVQMYHFLKQCVTSLTCRLWDHFSSKKNIKPDVYVQKIHSSKCHRMDAKKGLILFRCTKSCYMLDTYESTSKFRLLIPVSTTKI